MSTSRGVKTGAPMARPTESVPKGWPEGGQRHGDGRTDRTAGYLWLGAALITGEIGDDRGLAVSQHRPRDAAGAGKPDPGQVGSQAAVADLDDQRLAVRVRQGEGGQVGVGQRSSPLGHKAQGVSRFRAPEYRG